MILFRCYNIFCNLMLLILAFLIFLNFNFNLIFEKIKTSIFMGIGDWGLGIGDWGLGPIPNPQSPLLYFINILLKIIKCYIL